MKKLIRLTASILLAAIIPATCAVAQVRSLSAGHNSKPPKVTIISPDEGDAFLVGWPFGFYADVDNFTNPVAGVQFFAGTNSLGVLTNSWEDSHTYGLVVSNLPAGPYKLSAIATDTGGIMATSKIVDILVVTDLPPVIHIVDPDNKAIILGPTNVDVCAAAFDLGGSVASVQFFAGSNSLGVVPAPPVEYKTNDWGVFPIEQPFCLTWSNAPIGAYVLTAVATDDGGLMSTSKPVNITIVTDTPPVVHFESPKNNATYYAPTNITVSASAGDRDGSPVGVEFFAGTNNLGGATTSVVVTNDNHVKTIYSLTWSNVSAGTYILKAIATDDAGLTATSGPVKIKLSLPPPPKVIITSPSNGKTFRNAPLNINVTAFEWNFTNPVVNVQFLAGATAIGTTTNTPLSSIVWSNVPAGAYTLTAVAQDSSSLTVTSAPVNINVTTNSSAGNGNGNHKGPGNDNGNHNGQGNGNGKGNGKGD